VDGKGNPVLQNHLAGAAAVAEMLAAYYALRDADATTAGAVFTNEIGTFFQPAYGGVHNNGKFLDTAWLNERAHRLDMVKPKDDPALAPPEGPFDAGVARGVPTTPPAVEGTGQAVTPVQSGLMAPIEPFPHGMIDGGGQWHAPVNGMGRGATASEGHDPRDIDPHAAMSVDPHAAMSVDPHAAMSVDPAHQSSAHPGDGLMSIQPGHAAMSVDLGVAPDLSVVSSLADASIAPGSGVSDAAPGPGMMALPGADVADSPAAQAPPPPPSSSGSG
jgi:hypothetical protein